MLAVQSPWTRSRGIGRLSQNLVDALLTHDRKNEYVLYFHEDLPKDGVRVQDRARFATLQPDPQRGETTLHDPVDRLARTNPDSLDILLLLSPFDLHGGYAPPAKPLNGLKMASYVYDAIPFLFQEHYLTEPLVATAMYRNLERLRRYDVLMSCSESTRADFLRLLGLADRQIVNVSCDTRAGYFVPDRSEPLPVATARVLNDLGIDRPFVFNLGGMDPGLDRKNLFGLIEAFRLLPDSLRLTHQLVLTCSMTDEFANRLRHFAADRGVADRLVLTNEVADSVVRILYQRCAAFAAASLYEGFGLNLLEAMRCGAAVVAGNNSSQPEVVGDGGLLVNAPDPTDIAEKLARILADKAFARELGRKGLEQSHRFHWETTARRVVEALSDAPGWSLPPRLRSPRSTAPRPRIAVMSPFAPKVSGISDYTGVLIEHLKADYAIDLYHDVGYVPEPGLGSPEFGCHDYRVFARRAEVLNYDAVIYQMGNSGYHKFVYETMATHPGIVTLHDFSLAGFQHWYSGHADAPANHFRREIELFDPRRAREILARLADWEATPGGLPNAFERAGIYLNRSVFNRSEYVVCHSPWCRDEVARLFPDCLERTAVIPLGSRAEEVSADRRASIRSRFNLPVDALIFGSFGIVSSDKMNVEAIEAFASISDDFPAALLLFVGQDTTDGEARRKAEALGIALRVRFLGRQSSRDYDALAAVVDIGIGLRRPPTHGETSAALLDLLRLGVPTIVTDVTTFSCYPDTVVRKVPWEVEGLEGLRRAVRELASQSARREEFGRAARAYVLENHSWSRAAAMYSGLIERSRAGRKDRRRNNPASRPASRVDVASVSGEPNTVNSKRPERPSTPGTREGQAALQPLGE